MSLVRIGAAVVKFGDINLENMSANVTMAARVLQIEANKQIERSFRTETSALTGVHWPPLYLNTLVKKQDMENNELLAPDAVSSIMVRTGETREITKAKYVIDGDSISVAVVTTQHGLYNHFGSKGGQWVVIRPRKPGGFLRFVTKYGNVVYTRKPVQFYRRGIKRRRYFGFYSRTNLAKLITNALVGRHTIERT